ncbi:hypothetical protein DFAR_1380019 [Desulfarculales bacterium]
MPAVHLPSGHPSNIGCHTYPRRWHCLLRGHESRSAVARDGPRMRTGWPTKLLIWPATKEAWARSRPPATSCATIWASDPSAKRRGPGLPLDLCMVLLQPLSLLAKALAIELYRHLHLRVPLSLLALAFCFGTLGYWLLGRNWSFLNCAYMTNITLTTMGYGEILEPFGEREQRFTLSVPVLCGDAIDSLRCRPPASTTLASRSASAATITTWWTSFTALALTTWSTPIS